MTDTREIADARARAAVCLERGWTQGRYAVTGAGCPTDPEDPRAASWCTWGALKCAVGCDNRLYLQAVEAVRRDLRLPQGVSLGAWNDAPARTQAEVVAAVRGRR